MTWFDGLLKMFKSAPPPAPAPAPVPTVDDVSYWTTVLRAAGFIAPGVWAEHVAKPAARWAITRGPRAAAWAATLAHESGDGIRLIESLNYSADALLSKFGARRGITPDVAFQIGRTSQHPARQEVIANTIYGGEWGRQNLGNNELGDGWRFRGRGLIQLTGRANYAAAAAETGLALIDDPDQVAMPATAAEVAAWFWSAEKACNPLADQNRVEDWRRAINGGLNGLAEVKAKYANALRVA